MPRRYLHTELGYNSRLDALQAAVLAVKLPHLEGWLERRRAIADRYREALADLPGLRLAEAGPAGHSWNQFVVRILPCPSASPLCGGGCSSSGESACHGLPDSRCRDWVQTQLREAGVHTITYYPIPIHRQPAYASLGYAPGSLPLTERLCSEVLSLPIFPELSEAQQQTVIAAVRNLVGAAAARSASGLRATAA
jgi:dTDP-4-amino-4,6-dideoxygalactose transaminase